MQEKIKQEVRDYITKKANVEPDDRAFSDDADLYRLGYFDSVDSMSLVYFVESEFNIKITKEDILLNSMRTVNEIVQMVSKKLENGQN